MTVNGTTRVQRIRHIRAWLLVGLVLLVLAPAGYLTAQSPTATPAPVTPTIPATTGAAPFTATPLTFATPVPTLTGGAFIAQNFTLGSLGGRNYELASPQSSVQLSFLIPDNWMVSGTTTLHLNLEYFQTGTTSQTITNAAPPVSVFQVRLNDQLVSSYNFTEQDSGIKTLSVVLPIAQLTNTTNRRHTLQFFLDARDHCLSNMEARVFVRSDLSFVEFQYQRMAPVRDLALYPQPFFNNPLPGQSDVTVLVLPTDYHDHDLEAAASLAAGLGRLTGNRADLQIITADQLSEQARISNNLILIGEPDQNLLTDALYKANAFPTQMDEQGQLLTNGRPIPEDDGIVQIIAHPENPMMAILAVTGKTPMAMRKAVHLLSGASGASALLGFSGPLLIVSEIRPLSSETINRGDDVRQTFAQLGFQNTTLYGVSTQFAEFDFLVPPGVQITPDAYVNVVFDYSDTLRNVQSSVSIFLNGTPLNSMFLGSSNNATAVPNAQSLRASIRPELIRAGERNTLSLVLDVRGNWGCEMPNALVTWLTARPESEIYLPRGVVNPSQLQFLVSNFPLPFSATPDLHDTWIVLPENPTLVDIGRMVRIVERLGNLTENGQRFAPRISQGKFPDGVDLVQYNLIVMGRPTTNPILATLNPKLPHPFVEGKDELGQAVSDVSFRLPNLFDIGVVQIMRSPWSDMHAVLVISGTGSTGEAYAANVMVGQIFDRSELGGDVIYADARAVYAVNTRSMEWVDLATDIPDLATQSALAGSATPTNAPAYTVTPGPTPTPTLTRTPSPTLSATPVLAQTVIASVTPLPTFAPLDSAALVPEELEQPSWISILVVFTGAVVVVTMLYGLVTVLRRGTNGKS